MKTYLKFFDVNILLLKLGGMWVPHDKSFYSILQLAYNVFCFVYSAIIITSLEIFNLSNTWGEFDDFMKNINMACTHFLGVVKFLNWFRHRKTLMKIVDILLKNVEDFEECGDFKPDEIFKKDKKDKERISGAFLFLGCNVVISSYSNSLFEYFFAYNKFYQTSLTVNNDTIVTYEQKLPYITFIPWAVNTSRLTYGLTLLYQVFPLFNFVFIIVAADLLFIGMMQYTNTQIKIIQGSFITVRERTFKKLGLELRDDVIKYPEYVNKALNAELNKTIKALQVAFKCAEKIEEIYSPITLLQVFVSQTLFCSSLILISSIDMASGKFAAELVYMSAGQLQLWLYCYFGNEVTQRGENIPLSLYEADWFAADKSFKTSMIITMQRMMHPIHFTIGKFSPLTLTTFVSIGRGSYSFFAFLKNSN